MAKYATERIWRAPDGKLIPESEVKDGKAGGLGTTLAYAAGDLIEGEDEDSVSSKLASTKAPESLEATGLATAAPDSKPAKATKADKADKAEPKPVSAPVVKDTVSAPTPSKEA